MSIYAAVWKVIVNKKEYAPGMELPELPEDTVKKYLKSGVIRQVSASAPAEPPATHEPEAPKDLNSSEQSGQDMAPVDESDSESKPTTPAKSEKSLSQMNKTELLVKASELGYPADPSMTNEQLRNLITQAQK